MGGIFGGSGAGAGQLPAMSGFDANAVARALGAVGNNAQTGMRTGVPQGAMVNPLAQMLAQQGPAYQPANTAWGRAGDRLLRYTPQEGSMADIAARQAGGGAGGGAGAGAPPGAGINLGQLGAQLDANGVPVPLPAPNPTGAPAINTAMQKLQTPAATGPRPSDALQAVTQARATWKAIVSNPPARSASKAEKAAWDAQRVAAESAYIQAQKASGYGPGADPYSPFASGQVGSL